MRLINNLKFLDEPDIASLPNTDSKVKRTDKASAGPKVNSLLSGKRVPVNCQNVGQDSPNEIFYKGREILQEYQKMVQGHPDLTDFSTHPSDHTNLTGRNQPGEPENLDNSFSLGLHVILGQLNSSYDSPITAFACANRASCLKREDLQGSDLGFMASGHADGAIILYKVSQAHTQNLTGLHSDESISISLTGEADKFVKLLSSESNAPISVECISLALGNSGRIKVLKFVKSETGSVVFSVTDSGEVSKWDTRDGNCLATFQPPEQMDTQLIDAIFPVGIEDEYLLCTGPGTLLRLTASDLKLASNLSEEMFYTSALPILASRSIDQVPILVMGPNCGDITLGSLSLAIRESLNLLCKLSLRIEVVYWESNVYASSPDMQQVLLVSPSAFTLVQIEQTQTMRQLTQSIPPPIADDSWAGGFFMPENQLLVFTTWGSTYHYSWDAAGGLMRIGEATPTEAPHLATTRFTSIFWLNKDYLINVLPGSSLIIGTRINLSPASSANTLIQEWQQQLPKPGEVDSGVVTALTPIYLETESDPDPRPWVAKGFKDGTICVVPLAQMFDRSEKDATHMLSSQGYAITCLHQPSGVGKKQLLISGDACGGIQLWELSSWVRLASFQGHGQPVGTFFQFPIMPADQSLVFGLAQDASISIFCLKRMVCLGLIPGHRAPVSQVLCYPEAILEVVYSDGYHTYWILHPNGVRKWTEKVTVPRIFGVQLTRMRSPSLRADITCYPAWDMQHPFPVLQVFDINVRSLLRSMNSSIEPVVRLLNQAKNLPTQGEASRRTSILPEDSQPSSGSSLKLSKLIFYALLTKDADVSDILCDSIDPSANQLLIGLRGAGSKITFMLHESNVSKNGKAEVWKVSPHATASRLLPSIVMAKAAHTHEGNESKAIAVLTNYGCLLPELVGEAFQFPCLGYMAKFWQDSSPDVQSAARSLLLSLFSQLGFTRQRQLVDQWVTLLPQTVPIDLIHLRGSGLAVVVLGIILAHYPNLISDAAIRGRIARSLEWFVSNHTRPNFRLSAIQIVSSNFQHFETHVDGVWILRSLYGAYHEQGRHMQLISQQAVLQLALANTPLFITSLGLAKGIHQLSAIMQLVSFLVLNNQSLLLPYIPRVIEVIVKSLDPRDSEQRQSLISPATQCLHDLVAAYSTVDFHPGSQRLAVGVMEGAAVVYDLYTSTRCLVVEGYHSPVSAVAFSPDGKFLATFSAQESLLKIWNSAGGLFDMLAKTFRGHTPAAVPASKSRSNRAVNSMFLTLPSASDAAPVSAPTSGRTSPRNLAPPREYSGSISGSSSPLGLFSSSPTPYRTFNTSLGNSNSGKLLIDTLIHFQIQPVPI